MIPALPVLARPRLGSGRDGHYYDPWTLTVFLPRPADDASFTDRTVRLHESIHWIHYNGTSSGMLLNAVRHSQERTVLRQLRHVPEPLRAEVLKARFSSTSASIVQFHPDQSLNIEARADHLSLETLVQIWYDHQLTYQMFFDSIVQQDVPWYAADAIGDVMGDVLLLGDDYGLAKYPGNDDARAWYRPDSDLGVYAYDHQTWLSTVGIMECAAVVNELLYLQFHERFQDASAESPAWGATVAATRALLDDAGYGLAARIFREMSGMDDADDGLFLPALAAVCDIALNPPVPPLAPPGSHSWAEIYPPFVFVRACAALAVVGVPGPDGLLDHDACTAWIESICEAADVESTAHWDLTRNQASVDFDQVWTENNIGRLYGENFPWGRPTYFEYLLWIAGGVWELRQTDLPAVIFPGLRPDRFFRSPLLPPLWQSTNVLRHMDSETWFGSWLSMSAVCHAALFDLMVGVGPIDLSRTPSDGHDVYETVVNAALSSLVGVSIRGR